MSAETIAASKSEWRVFRMNDCDWYIARSLEEAKATIRGEYEDPDIDEDARELTEAELDKHRFRLEGWECECGVKLKENDPDFRFYGATWEHFHGYPIGHVQMRRMISFRAMLEKLIAAGPKPGLFASTEF